MNAGKQQQSKDNTVHNLNESLCTPLMGTFCSNTKNLLVSKTFEILRIVGFIP